MLTKKIQGALTIELEINAIKNKYYFEDISQLVGKNILYAIFSENMCPEEQKTPRNRALISSDAEFGAVAVFVNKSKEIINRLPLYLIKKNQTSNSVEILLNSEIDFKRSYIEFIDSSSLVVGQSILITVYHGDFIKEETDDKLMLIENIENVTYSVSQSKFNFGSFPSLNGKKLLSIRYYPWSSASGKTPVASNVIYRSYLTLVDKNGKEIIQKIPLFTMQDMYNYFIQWDYLNIDWEQSYIEVANTDGLVANSSFSFIVQYAEDKQRNHR